MKRMILAITAAALAAAPALAQRGGWTIIGAKRVGSSFDRDTITVLDNARFRQIRLCTNGAIRMMDFAVVFGNGTRQQINVRNRLAPGSCTRNVDLNGNRRHIDRIDLTYGRMQGGFRPEVRVMAR